MFHKGLICGISLSQKELSITPPQCDACMKGKATCALFSASKSGWAKSVLGLVHSDLWGPSPVTSFDGTCYMLTLTDNKSWWLWVIFLKSKGEALKAFVDWLVYIEKETGLKLCTICTDNWGEYLSQLWNKFLKECGIHHELTLPYTPKQNGVSEHQNCTIFNHICTILIDSGLPLFLLPEAIRYIVYTKNRHITWSLNNATPFEFCYVKKPDISNLHSFGCKAYVYNHSPKRNKLELQANKGIFVGYSDTQKAYQIYLPGKWHVVNTIHIKFNTSTMTGGQFQAEGEEQFCYSSLKSTFEPTKIKSKSVPNVLAPKTPEIILDEPTPPMRPPTPQTPHPLPSTPKQPLSANTPNSPLTPLPPALSPIINIPRSCSASRVLNTGGVSTPSPPACTSNHLLEIIPNILVLAILTHGYHFQHPKRVPKQGETPVKVKMNQALM